MATFTATLLSSGKTATGIEVPAEIEMPVEVTVDMPDDSMDAAADMVATNDFADDLGAIDTAAGELDGLMDI